MAIRTNWENGQWICSMPGGRLTLTGSSNGAMTWTYQVTGSPTIAPISGNIQSSGVANQDLNVTRQAAVVALRALAARISALATEVNQTA